MSIISNPSLSENVEDIEIFIDDGYDTSETRSQRTITSETCTSPIGKNESLLKNYHQESVHSIETEDVKQASKNKNQNISSLSSDQINNILEKSKRKKHPKHKSKTKHKNRTDKGKAKDESAHETKVSVTSEEIFIDGKPHKEELKNKNQERNTNVRSHDIKSVGDEITLSDKTLKNPYENTNQIHLETAKQQPDKNVKSKPQRSKKLHKKDVSFSADRNGKEEFSIKKSEDKKNERHHQKSIKNSLRIKSNNQGKINDVYIKKSFDVILEKPFQNTQPKNTLNCYHNLNSSEKAISELPDTLLKPVINEDREKLAPVDGINKCNVLNNPIERDKKFTQKEKSSIQDVKTKSFTSAENSLKDIESEFAVRPKTMKIGNASESLAAKPRKKMKSLFLGGRRKTDSLAMLSSSNVAKHPSQKRFAEIYHTVKKATNAYISINTAELNVLNKDKNDSSVGRTHTYGVLKKIKHLERLIKRLQYHVTQLDELYEEYNLENRYKEGAEKLQTALHISPVSSRTSRSSLMVAKADLACSVENMCQIERDFANLLGSFKIEMKGLLGFARLKSGDQYEVHFKYGSQKWKIHGSVKSAFDQQWDVIEHTVQPLLTELISIKLMEVKLLGKLSCVGNVTCETQDLFKAVPQDLAADLNDTGSLKLGLSVTWSPFEFSDATSTLTSEGVRGRTKSVVEKIPNNNESTSPRARPMSAMFLSYNFSNNNNAYIVDESSSNGFKADQNINDSLESDHVSVIPDQTINEVHSRVKQFEEPVDCPLIMTGHRLEEEAFLSTLRDNALAAIEVKRDVIPELADLEEIQAAVANAHEVGKALLSAVTTTNQMLDDYRGCFPQLKKLENKAGSLNGQSILPEDETVLDSFSFLDASVEDTISVKGSQFNEDDNYIVNYTPEVITCGNITADEALISHMNIVQNLLQDIGSFRPLQVKEIIALNRIKKQADIIEQIMQLGKHKMHPELEDISELSHNRTLLEFWRSCCDGRDKLCVKMKILQLELESEFGREVKRKHPDVAHIVFEELVHRIVYKCAAENCDEQQVTVYQLSSFVDDSIIQNEGDDLSKIIDKLALELFLTQTLSCGISRLVLTAIKRVSSLLALRTSNLCALSYLLLDKDQTICTAAAAHIKDMGTEETLKRKALVSYAELLESNYKRDRQCACVALGFLGGKECIPQLSYMFAADHEVDVREAARHCLVSFGNEGTKALHHAEETLLVQTMTHQVSLKNHARMGTAL